MTPEKTDSPSRVAAPMIVLYVVGIGVAWLFFSGGLLVTVTLANRIFARLDRRVTGGRP
jgi:Sec-independent protein secretion pathway component TatC